jgi:hypothetical protein
MNDGEPWRAIAIMPEESAGRRAVVRSVEVGGDGDGVVKWQRSKGKVW